MQLSASAATAAVFTKNAFCAAPVTLCREHMSESQGAIHALLINSGNANAGTGVPGYDMAVAHCATVADSLGVGLSSVLPFSTGVIGELLPDDKMKSGIRAAASKLVSDTSIEHWESAARGIMTTDTVPKLTSRQFDLHGQRITITGMAKGSGMIQPNMATMLSYVFTDARISAEDLDIALRQAVEISFNSITVDSDTSTNDAVVLSATGVSDIALTPADSSAWQVFVNTLSELCLELAQAIVRDGEGATKFITVRVSGGGNVGRLLMAIGKADIDSLDASRVRVSLGDITVFEKGGIAVGYTEELGAEVLAKEEILVDIDLARGESIAEVYTSDLSHEYVTINADYRT